MHRWAIITLAILLFAAPAFGLTNYYVDPTYSGGGSVGSAAAPWTSLDAGAWTAINAALATGAVTVYHSARIVASDTAEASSDYLNLTGKRTDASTNLLKLDGYSFYNTNDAAGSWLAYTGTIKSIYHGTNYGLAQFDTGEAKQNYITIEGFNIHCHTASGGFGVYWWGGDHVSFINNTINPGGLYIEYANYPARTTAGVCDGYILTGNTVSNPFGEGIYFGGGGDTGAGHTNITISNNTVYSCGSVEGQGDGIDIKDGETNLTVSGNTTYSNGLVAGDAHGITSMSPGTFSGNKSYLNTASGMYLDSYWGTAAWTAAIILQNNLVYGNVCQGIAINASTWAINSAVSIYNNSCYGNATGGTYAYSIRVTGKAASPIASCILTNNATSYCYAGGGVECELSDITTITENYNDWHGTISGFTRGANSLNTSPLFVSATDLQLQATSPCKNTGTTVASVTTDYASVPRPQGSAYDMGAYESRLIVTGAVNGGNGSISCVSPVLHGATSAVTMTPATGFHVESVTGTGCTTDWVSGNTCTTSALTADVTVTAAFSPDAGTGALIGIGLGGAGTITGIGTGTGMITLGP